SLPSFSCSMSSHSFRILMCLETAWRVISNSAASALGVNACDAINTRMALRVGSAMAWKTSLFICCGFQFRKPIGCKYIRNFSVSQNFGYFFSSFFLRRIIDVRGGFFALLLMVLRIGDRQDI